MQRVFAIQIIPRAQLMSFLTSTSMDPDQQMQVELTHFAEMIAVHAPGRFTHFVFTDHENGQDPEVCYPDGSQSQELIALTDAPQNGYYGLSASQPMYPDHNSVVIYNCYLGGSPASSAPGFVVTTAIMGI